MQEQHIPISDRKLIELGMRGEWLFINRGEFKKSPSEKKVLKKMKAAHNRMLRKAGINPKKQMNMTASQTMRA